jgi:hypothetical protein
MICFFLQYQKDHGEAIIDSTRQLIRTLGQKYDIHEEMKLFTYGREIPNDLMMAHKEDKIFVLNLDAELHMKNVKDSYVKERAITLCPPYAPTKYWDQKEKCFRDYTFHVFEQFHPTFSHEDIIAEVKRFRLEVFHVNFEFHMDMLSNSVRPVIQKKKESNTASGLKKITQRKKTQPIIKSANMIHQYLEKE